MRIGCKFARSERPAWLSHTVIACLGAFLIGMMLTGCSIDVAAKGVYGTYLASYPFGAERITLNRDGSFVQQVAMNDQPPVTAHGTWEFDAKGSRVNLYGLKVVVDGIGHPRNDWQTVTSGIVSLDVEKHWFRIVMASAATYPYVKQ